MLVAYIKVSHMVFPQVESALVKSTTPLLRFDYGNVAPDIETPWRTAGGQGPFVICPMTQVTHEVRLLSPYDKAIYVT
jgi:hypothetical protein